MTQFGANDPIVSSGAAVADFGNSDPIVPNQSLPAQPRLNMTGAFPQTAPAPAPQPPAPPLIQPEPILNGADAAVGGGANAAGGGYMGSHLNTPSPQLDFQANPIRFGEQFINKTFLNPVAQLQSLPMTGVQSVIGENATSALQNVGAKAEQAQFNVPPPTNLGQRVTDSLAGVASMLTQFLLFRKAIPAAGPMTGPAANVAAMEAQNLVSGGQPGAGGQLGAGLEAFHSIPLPLPLKAGLEGAGFAGLTLAQHGDPVDAVIQGIFPVAMRGGELAQYFKAKLEAARTPQETQAAIQEAIAAAHQTTPATVQQVQPTSEVLPQSTPASAEAVPPKEAQTPSRPASVEKPQEVPVRPSPESTPTAPPTEMATDTSTQAAAEVAKQLKSTKENPNERQAASGLEIAAGPKIIKQKNGQPRRPSLDAIARRIDKGAAETGGGSAIDHVDELMRQQANDPDATFSATGNDSFAIHPDAIDGLTKAQQRLIRNRVPVDEDADSIRDIVGDKLYEQAVEEAILGHIKDPERKASHIISMGDMVSPQTYLDAVTWRHLNGVRQRGRQSRMVMLDPAKLAEGDHFSVGGHEFVVEQHAGLGGLVIKSESMSHDVPLNQLEHGIPAESFEAAKPTKSVQRAMGAAAAAEFAPNFTTTGIAQRVTEARRIDTGAGVGTSPEASIDRGRQLIADGADPQQVIQDFNDNGKINADMVAIARAHGENLAKVTNSTEAAHGPDSEQYRQAFLAETKWIEKIKPLQTEWHRIGMAQQGETEVDTGTFVGLHRAYHDLTGKNFTPRQMERAKALAARDQKAQAQVKEATGKLSQAIDDYAKQTPAVRSLADRIVARLDTAASAALDRIKKRNSGILLRSATGIDPRDLADLSIYGAAKIAKGFTRFAEWSAEMVKDLGKGIEPHLSNIWTAADKRLDDEISKAPAAVRAALRPHADVSSHPAGTKMTPERVKALWEYAKATYIDNGETNLPNIAGKLATDFGVPVKDIKQALAQPKSLRQITNEVYRAQADRRKVKQQALTWVRSTGTPAPIRFASRIPAALFSLKVAGHGTVGGITHAAPAMMDVRYAKQYWPNFIRQFRMVASKGYGERMLQELADRPNYITARRGGLANDVGTTEEYASPVTNLFRGAGKRGFDMLKVLRQDIFDVTWDKLPATMQTPEMAKEISTHVNHLTGYGRAPFGDSGSSAAKVQNIALFAPKLEGSRWGWLVGDPVKAAYRLSTFWRRSPEEINSAVREFKSKATIVGTYMGLLALNQAILKATGSDNEINWSDPTKPDWLQFKIAGHTVGILSPMVNAVRFIVKMEQAMYGPRQALKGESRSDKSAHEAKRYWRGKLSPFGSVAADVMFQSDYRNRPMPFSTDPVPKYLREQGLDRIGYGEYLRQTLLMIPLEEAAHEVWDQHNDPKDYHTWLKAMGTAATMGLTGARVSDVPEEKATGFMHPPRPPSPPKPPSAPR